jgi:hypothetical protein
MESRIFSVHCDCINRVFWLTDYMGQDEIKRGIAPNRNLLLPYNASKISDELLVVTTLIRNLTTVGSLSD